MNQEDESKKIRAIKLKRLKFATEAYADHKACYTDPVTGEEFPGYKPWDEFRDEFIADWISNRRPINEKEDQVITDKLVDEALGELDALGAPVDLGTVIDTIEQNDAATIAFDTAVASDEAPKAVPTTTMPVDEATTAPKRRGRPPGSGKPKVIAVEANDAGTVELVDAAPKRRGRPPGKAKAGVVKTKPAKVAKKAAAKKAGGSNADKARKLIAMYGPKGRKWERKDVIAKLISQLGLGAATASTYYQNYK